MSRVAFWKAAGLSIGLLALGLSGCEDNKPAPAAGGTAKATAGAKAKGDKSAKAKTEAPKAGAYKAGDVVKYMPAECKGGRIFVNLSGVLGAKGMAEQMGALETQLVSATGEDQDKAKKVLAALKEGGFEPGKSLREMAVCIGEKDAGPMLAIALEPGQIKDPLGLIAKTVEAGGKPAPKLQKEGSLSYLKDDQDKGLIGQAAPNVLVVAKDKAAIVEMAKAGGAAGFADAVKHVIFASVPGGDMTFDVKVIDKGEAFDLWLGMKMAAGAGLDEMKKAPDAFVKQMQGQANKMADQFAQTPLKPLAERVKGAKFEVKDDTLVVTGTLPKADLAAVTKALATSKPEDLMKMMK